MADKQTLKEMQNEYEYYVAVKMTDALLDAGLITAEEHGKMIREHAKVFNPMLASLMPCNAC